MPTLCVCFFQILETPLPPSYRDLFARSHCRDCQLTALSPFHVLGLRCSGCGGYNTVREKGPLIRRGADGRCEL